MNMAPVLDVAPPGVDSVMDQRSLFYQGQSFFSPKV